MVYNRFFLLCLIRVILLVISISILSIIIFRADLLFTQLILGVLIIVQVIELTRFVSRTNQEIVRFISSIKDGDFSVNYTAITHTYAPLRSTFDDIMLAFKALETSKAAQLHFLKSLVDQIEFGIMVLNEANEIEILNSYGSDLLKLPAVKHWQNLKSGNIDFLKTISAPDFKQHTLEIEVQGNKKTIAIKLTPIVISTKKLRVFSFQDIRQALNQKEVDAWQKLIRILTHEVMNSVTPLVSLAETSQMILSHDTQPKKPQDLSEENIEDLSLAMETIRSRTHGMLRFVQQYRKLTKVPNPIVNDESLRDLVMRTVKLLEADLKHITMTIEVEDSIIRIDAALIEQVLINLILNACQAMQNQLNKELIIRSNSDKSLIITDSGPGIPENKQDKIFIPFFSTKKDGTGIGLSLCRQIMTLHNGSIELLETNANGTSFELRF
ncbi:MAG: hypothetical protein JXQ90_15660 [Cyclobacteriaceae bacterium]